MLLKRLLFGELSDGSDDDEDDDEDATCSWFSSFGSGRFMQNGFKSKDELHTEHGDHFAFLFFFLFELI